MRRVIPHPYVHDSGHDDADPSEGEEGDPHQVRVVQEAVGAFLSLHTPYCAVLVCKRKM